MGETMPKFNREEEEGKLGFKIEDKRRIDLEKIDKEIREEKEKNRFDSMTPEQREEWEYNRDQERGFTVKDKRFQSQPADMGKFKEQTNVSRKKDEDAEKLKKVNDFIKNFDNEAGKTAEELPANFEPAGPKPEIFAWKDRVEAFSNELGSIEQKFNTEKVRANTTFGYGLIAGEIKNFQKKFDDFAEKELAKNIGTRRDILIDEFSKISQRIDEMKRQINNYGINKAFNPIRRLGKKFGKLFRR